LACHKQVASSELLLQEEQAAQNRQLHEITEELIEMRVPTFNSNHGDKLVVEAIEDVRGTLMSP